jgi:hypothetical protein
MIQTFSCSYNLPEHVVAGGSGFMSTTWKNGILEGWNGGF